MLVGVLLGANLLSAILHASTSEWERRNLQAAVESQSRQRTQMLRTELSRSTDVLYSVGSLFATHRTVTREEFKDFVPVFPQGDLAARSGLYLRSVPRQPQIIFLSGLFLTLLLSGISIRPCSGQRKYQHFTLVENMTVAENLVLSRGEVPAVVNW